MSVAVDGFLYQLQVTPNIQWNLKYFQLRNGTLLSFHPVNNVMLVESIPSLLGYQVRGNIASEFASYSFSLLSATGEIVFTAISEEYTQYWVNALQAATKKFPTAIEPSPPFATLPQSHAIFNPSPLPYPFSTLCFDCNQGISKIVDEWFTKKGETDPVKEAFAEFEDILQYRYSAKSRTITHLFYATLNRQFDKMRTLVTSPEFTHKDRYKKTRFEYFTTVELCLFLCVIMGELEGVRVLVAGGARFDPEHHMGGFTPFLLAVAENKRDIACLIARHSPNEGEVMDLLSKPDGDEYFQHAYLNNIAQLLQITRPCLDPHVYPLPPTPSAIPLSPLEPITPPFFPTIVMPPSPPQLILNVDAFWNEPRLLRLVTSFKIPRGTILPVVESLLKNAPNYPPLPASLPSDSIQTVVTETDVLRLLTISGLKPKTRHKLHYTVKKMKNISSFYVKEQGATSVADEKGVAKWHVFSHNAGTVEMYAYNSETIYEPFICVLNSRIKKLPGDLKMELEVKPVSVNNAM